MYKIYEDLRKAFEEEISKGLTEKAIEGLQKDLRKVADSFEDDFMWNLKDNLAHNLTAYVADMAARAVEQMLAGNDDQMRRYLSCDKRGPDGQYIGWTGRSDVQGIGRAREDHELHPVIHGKLFEQGAVALRKQIASANEALIRDERIRDLEDQVKSLVAQVNKVEAEKEEMWQRMRGAA